MHWVQCSSARHWSGASVKCQEIVGIEIAKVPFASVAAAVRSCASRPIYHQMLIPSSPLLNVFEFKVTFSLLLEMNET